MERMVGKVKRIFLAGTLVLAVILATAAWAPVLAEEGSWVFGRLTGTHQPLPGYFRNNMTLHMNGIDRVEFVGYRLVREQDAKSYLIRPTHEGFFYQELQAGTYTLTRARRDRPRYRGAKTIEILRFDVPGESAVNLGTLSLVLDGPPDESLRVFQHAATGTYTYSYHYERDGGEGAYEAPLRWFTSRKPEVVNEHRGSITRAEGEPTQDRDGSEVVLREFRRPPEL